MRIFITRHGQVQTEKGVDDPFYPKGEIALSPLGREQARLTGERLKELGFCGKIYASPYFRTMETANIIADVTGSKVYPYAPIQELMYPDSLKSGYQGSPLHVLKEKFPHVADGAELEDSWRVKEAEDMGTMKPRIEKVVSDFKPDCEILFVGHGASSHWLVTLYGIPYVEGHFIYNCSLSLIDPEDSSVATLYCDVSHMPEDMVTNNHETKRERELKENQ